MVDPEAKQGGAPVPDEDERLEVLEQLEAWLETPMRVLAFVWLTLVVVELVWTTSGAFELLGTAIWIVFIGEFVLRFGLAPRKLPFLRNNVVTMIALAAPALRFLSALRFLRLTRGLRLVRVVGSANRGINALRKSFDRRGLGYVLLATVVVIVLGAAGMLGLEPAREVAGGFASYGDALWWTAMQVSTAGTGFVPVTVEGRLLAFMLSIYGLAVFGYITASLATFFIGQEAEASDGEVAGAAELRELRSEIAQLRQALGERPA
jgi:voltage-gated potassium channel